MRTPNPTPSPEPTASPEPTGDLASFDLLGPLPTGATTTVLEASAGTGKTYTLAGLVTRYVAEGHARLDQMLLITFGRAASQELRERVREQLDTAHLALRGRAETTAETRSALVAHLLTGEEVELALREERLRDALSDFDAATIATTHQFCQLVLRSLGVAGDSDTGVRLVEDLDDLVGEVVDDLYLQRFGQSPDDPVLTRATALQLAQAAVGHPGTRLTPSGPPPGTAAQVRVDFARDVLAELERRKRRLGVLGYDDLLGRLAAALAEPGAPARERMRRRWQVVLVDEFQDTDPVQWQVVERAFVGHATTVLIGDPKQAIYAFRGGDVVTYLQAARTAGRRCTLDTNYRSDQPLVRRLLAVLEGAALGHRDIVVREVAAAHHGGRLVGAPQSDPFRLRVLTREKRGLTGRRTIPMGDVRTHVTADLAADVAALLASEATYDGRPVEARDVAVIVESHRDARACRDALAAAGVPAVYTGDTDVFASPAAADWLCLLETFGQPHRAALVRAAATTRFFGCSAEDLARGGEALTDEVAQTVRAWADHARERGIAAVLESAMVAGMGARVLGWRGGERDLTDLTHLGQLLHESAHRDGLGLPALLEWLRAQVRERSGDTVRNRRLDSDAAAVQVMTVWVSKGLQYPVVYLPFAFNRHVAKRDAVLHHDGDERCLDIGGPRRGLDEIEARGRAEAAADDIRLTYVALTRAQSQVVAWWAPSWDEPNGGLSRLLRGRRPGEAHVPERAPEKPTDAEALAVLRAWEAHGGPSIEESRLEPPPVVPLPAAPTRLGVRRFERAIDTTWRRTSYSGLVRAADEARGVGSEPEVSTLDDESDDLAVGGPGREEGLEPRLGADLPSPMADLPSGAAFGSLVHAVLEEADPEALDLGVELEARVREQVAWWGVDVAPDELAAALLPLHHTPLGPLAPGTTLAQVSRRDRLCELDFEIPLVGGDARTGDTESPTTLADVGRLLADHLDDDDLLRPYAERLQGPGLGEQPLRGYLSGSIDLVLRVPSQAGPPRFLVVDYKTNRLGEPERPLTAADYAPDLVTAAMLHSDYPLQALLYVTVLHRYLRWRLAGYDPEVHLGGALYLYLRGMCGPDTPTVDGRPAGVFGWRPPSALVVALSDLLDGRT